MISLWVVFAIIVIHYIADFICQTEWQAVNKSKNWEALINHTFIYSYMWALPAVYWFAEINVYYPCVFFLITFICHTITDYFTSRLNSKLMPLRDYKWNREENINWYSFPYGESYHNFFIGVGGDQVLHYFQLLLTYWLLTK